MATTGFPKFSDGNVEIHLSTDPKDTLVLHSYVLALHSPWFKASLSERWNVGDTGKPALLGNGNTQSKAGHNAYWIYELRFEKDSHVGMLTKRSITPLSTEMTGSSPNVGTEVDSMRLTSVWAHSNVLGTLYHVAPTFRPDISALLPLIEVADLYACQHIARMQFEKQLLLHRSNAIDVCEADPVLMLELATRMNLGWVFVEAATYCIGQDNEDWENDQEKLVELGIADLMISKRTQFCAKLKACDNQLSRLNPPTGNGPAPIAAISYFRHWLNESLNAGKGSELGEDYSDLYHSIRASTSDEKKARRDRALVFLKAVHGKPSDLTEKYLPYVNATFEAAAAIVRPLLKNLSCQPPKSFDNKLTFIGVTEDELPWAGQ